jgi:hypothetical protein
VQAAAEQLSKVEPQPQFLLDALHAVSALMATDAATANALLTALNDLVRASFETARLLGPEPPR